MPKTFLPIFKALISLINKNDIRKIYTKEKYSQIVSYFYITIVKL
jgi:hypothetical protein